MKISHDKVSLLVREYYYPDIINRKCIHTLAFLCWFIMLFIGTTIIGVGTSNSSLTYPFCDDSTSFCTENILIDTNTVLYFYVKLTNYHQNNRMYSLTDSGSWIILVICNCMARLITLLIVETTIPMEILVRRKQLVGIEWQLLHRPILVAKLWQATNQVFLSSSQIWCF